jgi:4-amino-4-deoxy-L-arabinose transferase-like glycosyltransferase
VALVIALVAIALRVYAIDRLPPGLFGDEAVEGLDALDVLAGNFNIWFHAHLGREPLYVYLTALSYALFGVTPLATRLPALIAGLLTIPAAFVFVREWAAEIFSRERATRLALLTSALLAISFWHIQMTRNAHRDTLLPLVEAIGYALLWRALRTRDWRAYASAGAVLGLAIYTYSPGRFVGVFIALFVVVEFILGRKTKDEGRRQSFVFRPSSFVILGLCALAVMLPLAIYFAQNPWQFTRRFNSTSIFEQSDPLVALVTSVAGNLAQFVVPGLGYQSKHYNLPGKPIFDLLIAPWFLIGIIIAIKRWRQPQYRFLLLWFVVMCFPAFLTADMIPKGVRVLGVVPGVFVFPALAIEAVSGQRSAVRDQKSVIRNTQYALVALSLIGSALWTTHDYFVAWANHPEVPLKFDSELAEASAFIQQQTPTTPIYISTEVYRHPTLMLLGERVPTSRYFDRATRFKESDARRALIFGANQSEAVYVFIRDYAPPFDWLTRVAPNATHLANGEYFTAWRLGAFAPPQRALNIEFNPYLKLVGVSRYDDEPRGIVLHWQVIALPPDRKETDVALALLDARGDVVTEDKYRFAVPPLEWNIGDTIVEWSAHASLERVAQLHIVLTRGGAVWQSPSVELTKDEGRMTKAFVLRPSSFIGGFFAQTPSTCFTCLSHTCSHTHLSTRNPFRYAHPR